MPEGVAKITVRQARWVVSDSIVLVGDETGQSGAPLVVLLHGGGQTRHSWSGTQRALTMQGYHVVNFDARGHGDSGWSLDGRYPLSLRAHDLSMILAGRTEDYVLVGASLGGATAMQAISEGLRPNALVLVDIVPSPDLQGIARIKDFMTANQSGFASLDEAAAAIAARIIRAHEGCRIVPVCSRICEPQKMDASTGIGILECWRVKEAIPISLHARSKASVGDSISRSCSCAARNPMSSLTSASRTSGDLLPIWRFLTYLTPDIWSPAIGMIPSRPECSHISHA